MRWCHWLARASLGVMRTVRRPSRRASVMAARARGVRSVSTVSMTPMCPALFQAVMAVCCQGLRWGLGRVGVLVAAGW